MADQIQWQLSGDYFENCNCSIVCPCLVSTAAPLTSRPTEGYCDVPLIFHIEKGKYGNATLDGLNVVVAVHTPGKKAMPITPPLAAKIFLPVNRWATSRTIAV